MLLVYGCTRRTLGAEWPMWYPVTTALCATAGVIWHNFSSYSEQLCKTLWWAATPFRQNFSKAQPGMSWYTPLLLMHTDMWAYHNKQCNHFSIHSKFITAYIFSSSQHTLNLSQPTFCLSQHTFSLHHSIHFIYHSIHFLFITAYILVSTAYFFSSQHRFSLHSIHFKFITAYILFTTA